MLLLPADMLGKIVTKGKLKPLINVKATTATCAGLFVWISYLGWNLPLQLTLGYKAPRSRRGDGGELELVLFAEASMDQVHILSECLEQFFFFFRAEGKQVEDTGLLF